MTSQRPAGLRACQIVHCNITSVVLLSWHNHCESSPGLFDSKVTEYAKVEKSSWTVSLPVGYRHLHLTLPFLGRLPKVNLIV